jgi:hypothetical protein
MPRRTWIMKERSLTIVSVSLSQVGQLVYIHRLQWTAKRRMGPYLGLLQQNTGALLVVVVTALQGQAHLYRQERERQGTRWKQGQLFDYR